MRKNVALVLLSYAGVYVFWGMTYYLIRVSGITIPAVSIMAVRWLTAGLLFTGIALLFGRLRRPPTAVEILSSILLGVLLILGGNGLVVIAEKKVDSYLAALVITSTPLVVAFFDFVLWRRKISFAGLAGILLGIAGVGMLLWTGGNRRFDLRPEIFYLLGACVSWSLASSLSHKLKVPENIFLNSGVQMLSVGLMMAAVILLIPRPAPGYFSGWSPASLAGLVLLTVVGTLGFLAFTYLLRVEPAVRVVSYSFVNPLIAVFLGVALGHEKTVPLLVPGLASILAGLFLLLYFERIVDPLKAGSKEPE